MTAGAVDGDNGLDRTGLDWTGLGWTELDWTGPDWTGLESLITTTFQVQLETASQWDRWYVELESNLKMIIGAKGIALGTLS